MQDLALSELLSTMVRECIMVLRNDATFELLFIQKQILRLSLFLNSGRLSSTCIYFWAIFMGRLTLSCLIGQFLLSVMHAAYCLK
jgi:hypothetical protein